MNHRAVLLTCFLCLALTQNEVDSQKFGDVQAVYEWTTLDLDWPSEAVKEEFINNGSFAVDKNVVSGIKVYKNEVYLSIPRWLSTTGIPVSLVKVVKVGSEVKLRPYPDWASQTVGDCQALQYVQSMEIDPNSGRMYVIDAGRNGLFAAFGAQNLCPAKIVVYDLHTDQRVASYDLPDDVVKRDNNFLNDIVLDYVDGQVKYAYITDVNAQSIHVFDFGTKRAWSLKDEASMKAEPDGGLIVINEKNYTFALDVDGIAMSSNFDYVYYSSIGAYSLYQVPTSTLRNGGTDGIRLVGKKGSQSDGMAFSSKRLYYGALSKNAVYYWDIEKDMRDQNKDISHVTLNTQTQLVKDDLKMQWPDTFAIDEEGYLWFTADRLQLLFTNTMNFTGPEINMRIYKVFINETSYLHEAESKTASLPVVG
ncbi:protein yellow isoform X2 [Aplysia californica]|uniref:Protein yellow isoform X2 n=1 Tax=Aplysia californica TaxID=6500 RepID=A0ABM1A6Z8_APLCA|nr:protein yellow isoform X2 [Aplysia californica]